MEPAAIVLSREMRDELLDPGGWDDVLAPYARTVGLAVALTDSEGRMLGTCHNAQPLWLIADRARRENSARNEDPCSFCLDSSPCQAVRRALSTGRVEQVSDQAGMVHLAVPLSLGEHQLGAIIAGQVFDRYPEPLRLQRIAQQLGVSPQQFWQEARQQSPVRNATLQVYGELLLTLGKAFLRQRYAAILDRELARTNLRLRLALDGIEDHALFTVDSKGAVTSWNRGAERIFGHSESDVMGRDFSRLFTAEDVQAGAPGKLLQQASHEGRVEDHGWQMRKDGTRFFAESSLAVLGKGGAREFGRLTHDVTDRRKNEEALRQAQKLESIGVLASGIAHDFNNLLTCILGGVTFAMTSLPTGHPACPSLTIAEEASAKAADLTHQLLAYAGQGKFVVTQFDLSVLIQNMIKLLWTSIPKSVSLQLALEPDLPWIEADASQIQQVVMNLVINGAESIGVEGGSLRVSTGTARAENPAEGQTGDEVWMEVRDSGSGMTEATKAHIFDPFFSTKFTGRGLGLAAVSGIVRGHEGRMEVESALGKGSTFRITFPGIEKPPERHEEPPPKVVGEQRSGTILVVEDEPSLRMLAKAILERDGYEVMTVEDGRAAVKMLTQHAATITAILLDMTMPVMGGEEAFHLLRAIRGDVPIVLSTGYSETTIRDLFTAGTVMGFIQKPYTSTQLCEIIRSTSVAGQAVKGARG
jgi:PAS domain S-box-containing protein